MPARRAIGLSGLAVGLVTAGAAVAVVAQRHTIGRLRGRPDPEAAAAYGRLRADRSYSVAAEDGVRLHVEELGPAAAPLVCVFVHGYTLAMGSWHFQRIELARWTDPVLRLVFYDQRSHGRSQRGPANSCDIDQLGRDLAVVIRSAACGRPVILIGHSMGGMTIMALADQRPELFGTDVLGVALLSTTTGGLTDVDLGLPRALGRLQLVVLPVLAKGMRARPQLAEITRRSGADVSWLLTRWYSFGDRGVSPALVDYVGRLIAATPVDVIAEFLPTLMGNDRVTALPVLRGVETLILAGDSDRLTPLAQSRAMAEELPEAEFVVVPGAGHLAMMEQPETVDRALAALVRRAYRRRR